MGKLYNDEKMDLAGFLAGWCFVGDFMSAFDKTKDNISDLASYDEILKAKSVITYSDKLPNKIKAQINKNKKAINAFKKKC